MFIFLTYFYYVTITLFICSIELRFLMMLELLYFEVFQLGMEKTIQSCFAFARHCDVILLRHNDVVLLRRNYVIYLFDVVTFFDNFRIMLYFGTFEFRMEITLQLRFVFARHCEVFFCYIPITLFICLL